MPRTITGVADNTKVEPDQEYRILAYDRQDELYRFINKTARTSPICNSLLGQEVVRPRYECQRAYVFAAGTEYPTFTHESLSKMFDWGDEHCVEQRKLPKWWAPEILDMNCSQIHNDSPNTIGYKDWADEDYSHLYYGGYFHPEYYMYMNKRRLLRKQREDQELEYHI
jgi:hypothetical protein